MKTDKEKLLHHIEEDKKFEMRRLIDKIETVEKRHITVSTDFLDPYEVYLAKSILNRFQDISYKIDGGYEDSERSIIYIFPEYLYETEENHLSILKIISSGTLEHKDILGSLTGLGIDRRKTGDILINDCETYIIVKSEISDFIEFSLKKVGRNNIKVERTDQLNIPENKYTVRKYIVSSLRLDAMLSAILGISRAKASQLIENEKVKINFKIISKTSFMLKEGDLISVRKYGRFKFQELTGMTKKDNYIVKVKIPN